MYIENFKVGSPSSILLIRGNKCYSVRNENGETITFGESMNGGAIGVIFNQGEYIIPSMNFFKTKDENVIVEKYRENFRPIKNLKKLCLVKLWDIIIL